MSKQRFDENSVLGGFLWGFLIGGLVALARIPSFIIERRKQLLSAEGRKQLVVANDPVANSLDVGKALAEQRRKERYG
jgi:hypothetical protein